MKTYQKNLILAILLIGLIFIASCTPVSKQNTIQKKELNPIKIAFVSSMTGDAGRWGQEVKKGFDFALNELNSKGGINGRQIKVIYEDDECDANKGALAFNKVIELDKVKILTGTVCSSVAMAGMNKVKSNNVLYIASGATSPEVTKQSKNVFRLWVADDYEAKALADYAIEKLGAKTFGVIACTDNPACIALKSNFIKQVEKHNKTITDTEKYVTSDKNIRTELTKLIKDNPDAVYLMAYPKNTALYINQLKELGYKGKILTYSPAITAEGVIEQIKDKSNIYYVSSIEKKETDFWQKYKQKTGEDADSLIALGYDSMKIIEAGLKQCGENNDCIRDYFYANKFPLSRGIIQFDENGDLTGISFEGHKV